MRKKNKILTILLVLALVFSGFPASVFADEIQTEETVVVLSENGENIDVLKELDQPEVIYSLPSETEVTSISEGSTHTYIRFIDVESNEEILGYVENVYIHPITTEETDNNEAEEVSGDTETEEIIEEVPTTNELVEPTTKSIEVQTDKTSLTIEMMNTPEDPEPPVEEEVPPVKPTLYGIGLQAPTNVYAQAEDNAAVLKTYTQGTRLKYEDFNDQWYTAVVYLSGVRTEAFIKKADVETIVSEQETLTSYANKQPLTVYAKASRDSAALKSYRKGSSLKFKTYTSEWYEATVYVNGKPRTGYIHKDDVTNSIDFKGIGLAGTVNVYSEASTTSGVLKSYAQGSLLKYKTYNNSFYEAKVYINGVPHTGYIAQNDVQNIVAKQETLYEITMTQVPIYSKASTNSSILKSYAPGSKLKFKTFTSDWYQATVFINGKAKTGYIKKSTLKSFKGKVIVIDAGHGGFDPGAIGTRGTKEKILNLQTALQVKSLLEAKGAKVVMTRSNDTFLALSERVTVSHNYGADVFVSIHYNSTANNTIRGIETYYWNTNVNEQYLAATVHNEIVKATGLRDRNVRLGNYHVLRENKNPAILVELGYLSNSLEEMTVNSASYHKKAATGIYNGIVKYFFN